MKSLGQIFAVLKEAALFMIAARVLLLIFPGKKYDRYGKMVVALAVLSQLIVPVLSFGNEDFAAFFQEKADGLEAQNEMFSAKMEGLSRDQEDLVESGLILSVEEKIAAQARQAGVEIADVRMGEEGVIIEVKAEGSGAAGVVVDPVEIKKVELNENLSGEENTAVRADAGARRGNRREDLEQLFAAALGMGEKEVEVIELQ